MTRSGKEYIEGLSDNRRVFINGEYVSDVTNHPAFKGAVESVARVYDLAHDPANASTMTFPSPLTGAPVNLWATTRRRSGSRSNSTCSPGWRCAWRR